MEYVLHSTVCIRLYAAKRSYQSRGTFVITDLAHNHTENLVTEIERDHSDHKVARHESSNDRVLVGDTVSWIVRRSEKKKIKNNKLKHSINNNNINNKTILQKNTFYLFS